MKVSFEKVRKDKKKAQRQKEEADAKSRISQIKKKILKRSFCGNLSEESGLSYQEMKELILPAHQVNQGVNHV